MHTLTKQVFCQELIQFIHDLLLYNNVILK